MSFRKNISKVLFPLTCWYAVGVRFRNMFYSMGIIKQEAPHITTIGVGNLSTGGTGKTPHVEHLVRLLRGETRVAVLSRGYRRQTKGFVLADAGSTAATIGDEPLQMHRKFGDITVAVDADRRHGIALLLQQEPKPGVILLDDAYQHRYVKAGLNILLTDYHRLFSRDLVLPAGRLREPRSGKRRADIVVVTKCPPTMSEAERQAIASELALETRQHLYFSCIDYAPLEPLAGGPALPLEALNQHHVLLLSGIANPTPLENTLKVHASEVRTMQFADHHTFTASDMERVADAFGTLAEPRLLVTTETDAARLEGTGLLPPTLREHGYTIPIRIRFLFGQGETFDEEIKNYGLV